MAKLVSALILALGVLGFVALIAGIFIGPFGTLFWSGVGAVALVTGLLVIGARKERKQLKAK